MSLLEVSHITKYFKNPEPFKVLNDVTFTIKEGEFVSIVGKSGCGKSTLLYILSTMDTDYEGDLIFNDKNLRTYDHTALSHFRNAHIGFVFQFHYLLPEFTAIENVMLPGKKLGKLTDTELKLKATEKLSLLGLKEFKDKKANNLSGGQQQRVAIARALINEPELIMCDEPTGNLDSINAENVFNVFSDLASKGQSILMVTHDGDFASRTDRKIILSDGMVIQS